MKYNITINQKGLENDTNISITDASVIDWLHSFCGSTNRKINAQKLDGWTWVNLTFLITDMPLLRISSRAGASKLLNRLEELGYIERKTENKKIFVRPTSKMDDLYFVNPSKQVVNQSEEVVNSSKQSCKPQLTDHNTNTIILDNNTKPVITLSQTQGKTPINRLQSLYGKLFHQLYGFLPKNYAQTGTVFKSLLDSYSEIQVACLLIVFFNWHGMDDKDDGAYKWLTDNAHSPFIFKTNVAKYEAYARNVAGWGNDFNNDEILYKVVKNKLIEVK